ncbi:hypothetical protein GCM10011583_71570 [Streptomyces camponoticapitis]|uniref:Uncharacterized protein n=1 Tax=Streptomyces camponoticapitis TaxID=1616125 RepID=A0ABQ2EW31_9ACTN|nr:hypothetical protein GCM10011583_71570 [Streptomyces camponoticapitis]
MTTEHSRTGYNRDLLRHWITISGRCDTRETILKHDGTNVVTNSLCSATSGRCFDGLVAHTVGPQVSRGRMILVVVDLAHTVILP